ncbi:hypothetical protein CNMCM8980_002598 [Aspergillus fumigatiaffinis]|uniref:C2H2-type domain-containing protein n=1 Tax=Aspergillus fumigatiaffinis TaxID=340414 RepID=A0A8H4GU17_9EURO|nr:hypothetical protein CNMCM5878_004943 [Aspergillus fumigatiaffinis]KAF4228141.1 hypothetical protein CNMCM6457_007006 [Aspergillus fumigatiaffinis]KAF4244325.1 hypothetical protein CNMCM6805_009327 [Aspergillus fumigatiaffinis]KAF4249892.1 hypothetical protein CNMCM8980_002598 [Aspergillus fumigatiaffinis]
MANDYFEWLQNHRETGHPRFPQQSQYASSPSPGYPDSFLDFPPTSQTPLSDSRQPYHYQTHYAPLEQYVRPQDSTYSSSTGYPFTSYQGGQQYRANPPATTQQPPPAPPPPLSNLSQPLPTNYAQTQPQNASSYLNYPPFTRATEVVDADVSGHDAKRRRLESPLTVTLSKPTMPPQESLSKYSFTPQDTTDRSYLKTRADIAKPLNVTDAAEKLQYDPKTIARDVLIASGRHPTEAPLNHHLFRLRDVFTGLDTASDLETLRWDLVDPEEKQASNTTTARDVQLLSALAHVTSAMACPAQPNPPYAGVAATPKYPHQQHQPLPQLQPRPPHTLQKSQTVPQQRSPCQPNSQKQVQPPSDPQPRSHPPPQVQLQVQPPSQPQPKPGPSIQIRTKAQPSPKAKSSPRSSTNMVGRRPPGRPPASSKIEVTIPVTSQIPYQVYTCGWENCQAELHNLEMLKKHIFKVHVPYTLTCQWKDCTFRENLPAVQLYKHVLSEHVVSIAWTLGDGPSVPATEGRVAGESPVPKTIPESIQPGGEDSLIFPASYSSIRAFNRVHGNHTQIEKAREIFKAVQRLKEHIGYGLDPGGCQLATPTRIGRVSNDEDVYAVRHES